MSKNFSNEECVKKLQQQYDDQLFNELVQNNKGLIIDVAKHFKVNSNVISNDDMIQAGIIGLFNAVDKFDAQKDVKFSTYARSAVKNEMKKAQKNELKKFLSAYLYSQNEVSKKSEEAKNKYTASTIDDMLSVKEALEAIEKSEGRVIIIDDNKSEYINKILNNWPNKKVRKQKENGVRRVEEALELLNIYNQKLHALSLNYNYEDSEDSENTLLDYIPDTQTTADVAIDNVMQSETMKRIHRIISEHKQPLECLQSTKVLDADLAEKNRASEYYKMIKKLK